MPEPLVIWRYVDGTPGHEKQTAGLIQGLEAHAECVVVDVDVRNQPLARIGQARRAECANPDLVIGAGHSTHASLLAARFSLKAKAVVLMKPSLPTFLFDLVLVPEHDRVLLGGNVERTAGALCPFIDADKEPDASLLMLGGPSRHVRWQDEDVIARARGVVQANPDRVWTVGDSRRTPDGVLSAVCAGLGAAPEHWRDTESSWLVERLGASPQVWVTADSVSMLYEALAANAQVGVIDVPFASGANKIERSLAGLVARGAVTLASVSEQLPETPPGIPIRENLRCGEAIVRRWFSQYLLAG